jgi:cytochrome P450 PksS
MADQRLRVRGGQTQIGERTHERAAHETTVNLIGNGVLALLEHPEQMERLRSDPGLIRPAVEEFLRYDAPVAMASERYAREDLTVAGVTMRRGDLVVAVPRWVP